MKIHLTIIFSFFFLSCDFISEKRTNHEAILNELQKETDSLKEEINKLKKHAVDTGSSLVKDNVTVFEKRNLSEIPVERKENTTTDKRAHPSQKKVRSKSDTIFYFYTNTKKISARIDPRDMDQKMHMIFYDPSGNITFEQEDVYKSYSISTELKEFHMNGAVKRIVIHYNPGASLHWYETIITFDMDNVPAWKEEITYPLTLEGMMDNKFY